MERTLTAGWRKAEGKTGGKEMQPANYLSLLGGLALFLHGMQQMSSGLEAAAGNRMKQILERLTTNRFLGVAVGCGITAVIQSSSATTVMVVGFVNSGMMTLQQAVWVIMGANIGTTITAQLIALDVGAIAPLFAFLGVAVAMFVKKPQIQHYGQIIAGLGILFVGMEMMSSSMEPLRESEAFIRLMTQFSNPVLGILAGMIFTAIIQSSSASVGILQALAVSGVIDLGSAVYVLFGQNIGTCITAVLASIGTTRNAKRTTIIHLMFNIIGTAVFTLLCLTTPLTGFMESLTPGAPAAQIANMHTLFNITTTLLLLPLGTKLAALSVRILPDQPQSDDGSPSLLYLKPIEKASEYQIGTAAIALTGLRKELARMTQMAASNVEKSFAAVLEGSSRLLPEVEKMEDYVDYLNQEISRYISRVIAHETNQRDSAIVSSYFKITGNLERISDHALNICEYTKPMEERGITFSSATHQEIREMQRVSTQAMSLFAGLDTMASSQLEEAQRLEQEIDDMSVAYRENQIRRMKGGSCSEEACVLYSEMLTDFERIGDHILNIGEELAAVEKSAQQ